MKRGAGWEARLEHWHRAYEKSGSAYIVKCNPPVRLLSRPDRAGRFQGCFSAVGPPDYIGVISGGRTVAFDAKDCKLKRWPLASLATHQARALQRIQLAGGISFVALRMLGETYVLPWTALEPLYRKWHAGEAARGGASLSMGDVEQLGVRMADDGWIGVLQ